MQYLVLASDYDGTLAKDGQVSQPTIRALEQVVASGRKLLLVTGRLLPDLQRAFDRLDLFAYVVAENGALLYQPASATEQMLAEPPPVSLLEALKQRDVVPLDAGRVIVSTWHPHETTVLEVIRDLGLERQVIFNKGAVMVLPATVNKSTGLAAALQALRTSPHNAVGIGDAENDHAFLTLCECAVAVSNALPALQEQADYTTRADHGEGVSELIEHLLATDLQDLDQCISRRSLLVGTDQSGQPIRLPARRRHVLIAGPSGSGKSRLAISLLEQLAGQAYQFCLIDPEGDYETVEEGITLGDAQQEPSVAELLQVLDSPAQSAIVNLLSRPLTERPILLRQLLPSLQQLQLQVGHPHWLIIDEAHHVLPPEGDTSSLESVQDLFSLLLITTHPEQLSKQALSLIDVVISVGPDALSTLQAFSEAVGQPPPRMTSSALDSEEICVWFRRMEHSPRCVRPTLSKQEHQRHRRKYAQGSLAPELSFYFRGPEGKLQLRAQNLLIFNQIAQGVDDATWLFHLRQGDYSRWFRQAIKDEELAAVAESVEQDKQLSAQESRARIQAAIEQNYTVPG